jgi:hypothetical protein
LRLAYQLAATALRSSNPRAIAAKSGADYREGYFLLPFFHRRFRVLFPQAQVHEEGTPEEPPLWLQVTLLHYLLMADGTPMADRWIAFRELPGGYALLSNFEMNTIAPLGAALGRTPEQFRAASLALGGTPMGLGDLSFRFLALPRLALGCILWLGDEEAPPAINLVYDAAAPHYLPTEDLAALAEYLSQALRRAAGG